MADIVTYQPASLMNSWGARSKTKELSRLKTATDISAARHCAAIDVVESVTESALLATSHLAALEGHLMTRVPEHARVRLAVVGENSALAMSNVVARLARP